MQKAIQLFQQGAKLPDSIIRKRFYRLNLESDFPLVIVGGGTAGLTMLNSLVPKLGAKNICIIEPSKTHHYQPLWTLIGGGVLKESEIARYAHRPTENYIPNSTTWIQEAAVNFDPTNNQVILNNGKKINYEYLIVAGGLQINWQNIKGLSQSLGRDGVCSNYAYEYSEYTRKFVDEFQGGNAIFTFPNTPVKCAGAPQKIMYLAHDAWQKAGVPNSITFSSAVGKLFSVDKYCKSLENLCDSKGIKREFGLNLVEVRSEDRKAIFQVNKSIRTDDPEEFHELSYDFLHVTPPMGPPNFIKNSVLADSTGFVSVNKDTLQHDVFSNVFALGDCTNLPTSKTATAICAQSKILTDNLISYIKNGQTPSVYDGYTACPIPVGNQQLIMAEFNYKLEPCESWIFSQDIPSTVLYKIKKYILPDIYWNGMLNGVWKGPQYSLGTRLIRYFKKS